MNEYESKLMGKLIEHLQLEDVDLSEITGKTQLFGDDGLEFDSIDAIEIEIMIQKEYGVDILPSERSKSSYSDLGTLSGFIQGKLVSK